MLNWALEHEILTTLIILVLLAVVHDIIANICNTVNSVSKRKGDKK